jgi:hypothetical protein
MIHPETRTRKPAKPTPRGQGTQGKQKAKPNEIKLKIKSKNVDCGFFSPENGNEQQARLAYSLSIKRMMNPWADVRIYHRNVLYRTHASEDEKERERETYCREGGEKEIRKLT